MTRQYWTSHKREEGLITNNSHIAALLINNFRNYCEECGWPDENRNPQPSDWQDLIRDEFVQAGVPDNRIDGGGCDSGDPLDFSRAELKQGINHFRDYIAALEKALEPFAAYANSFSDNATPTYCDIDFRHCRSAAALLKDRISK